MFNMILLPDIIKYKENIYLNIFTCLLVKKGKRVWQWWLTSITLCTPGVSNQKDHGSRPKKVHESPSQSINGSSDRYLSSQLCRKYK
jgi:hypothetical protein